MTDQRLELVLDNDREWRKLLLENQTEIFKKLDAINQSFSEKQIDCEKRFTKLEIKSGFWGFIGGLLGSFGFNLWK